MKFIKQSQREQPKVSIVLLDWSVRESFHLLYYLRQQGVPREDFEVIVVEYYSRVSEAASRYAAEIDTWVVLEMSEECYYHKHLMYNAGIAVSQGDVCVFCDSDAMVKPGFIEAIIAEFEQDPHIVLHLDQFRNVRRDLYPFAYPNFDDVLGPGCINQVGGVTRGLADPSDPLHERNYGACMAARREDLIAIGGSDEHVDYLGHVCGPYEMTFRLVNFGRREIWHPREFMYHTWHPGQAGVNNYLGPHDGRHMSTTALEALTTGRVYPFEENRAVAHLRAGGWSDTARPLLVQEDRTKSWTLAAVSRSGVTGEPVRRTVLYRGFKIEPNGAGFVAQLLLNAVLRAPAVESLHGGSVTELRGAIDKVIGSRVRAVSVGASIYVLVWRVISAAEIVIRGLATRVRSFPGRVWRGALAARRRVRDRWRQFVLERRFLSGTLASLLVSIHFIGEVRRAENLPPPVVIVDGRAMFNCLKLVGAARLITPVDIIRIDKTAHLDRWVEMLVDGNADGHIIVGRDLYMRHYGSLSRLRAMKRLVVA